MKTFLRVIAKGYTERYPDISRLTFIMPNKRSGAFLLREFNSSSSTPAIGPEIISISDFVAMQNERVVDSRLDLLFRLYDCYRRLPGSNEDMTFEKFYSWGETVLTDFNEVDMHMADAEEVFKNVKDLNEIRSDFLTPEQKEVMVEYFGYTPEILSRNYRRFWETATKETDDGKEGVTGKFRTLWQLLWPLYKSFAQNLKEHSLLTPGAAYRALAEKVEAGVEPFPGQKIVFVGFNALSESERRIFKGLKEMSVDVGLGDEPKADFLWDEVSRVFADREDPAVRFITANMRSDNFPMPKWMDDLLEHARPTEAPEIEVISVPSNVMQVKVAAEELKKIYKNTSTADIHDAKVAVILPDENLLLPLLYSLPEDYSNPNLTMGFPLKHTPVISFAALLRRLHQRAKISGKSAVFFFEDVRDLLGHPYARILFSSSLITDFVDRCESKRRVVVTEAQLSELGFDATEVFRFIPETDGPGAAIDYIRTIFTLIGDRMGRTADTYRKREVEQTYIKTYLDAVRRLGICLQEFDHRISVGSVFSLADRLIAGERVAFEGEPLQGLQVMGMLETRCLDFEKIVMLSVNEKILPRVGRNTTFVPNALRCAHGMAPANYQEELFAYYFFRIVGRSQKAVLTYDSRTSDSRTAGVSRYVLQMKYREHPLPLKERETRFDMPRNETRPVEFAKEGEIMKRLERYIISGPTAAADEKERKNFSPSTINHYLDCPLKFLYQDLMEIYMEREKMESIDAIDLGTIVHNAIEHLYLPDEKMRGHLLKEPVVMTRDKLRGLLNGVNSRGENLVTEAVRKRILRVHFNAKESELDTEALRGSALVIMQYIEEYVRKIILHDISIAPFRLWGTEIKETMGLTLEDGREVGMKMVIDRLDQLGASDPDAPFRVVDYKTGSAYLKAETLEAVFDGTYQTKYLLQLLLYSELFLQMMEELKAKGDPLPGGADLEKMKAQLQPVIYNVLQLGKNYGTLRPEIGEVKDLNMGKLRSEVEKDDHTYLNLLRKKIAEILSPDYTFSATPSDDLCSWCDYRLRCEVNGMKQNKISRELRD